MRKHRIVFVCVALNALACLDTGSASVHLKGEVFDEGLVEVDRRYSFGAPEASPDWNAPSSAHTASYTMKSSSPFAEIMTMTVYVPTLALGPFDGQLSVNSSSRGTALTGPIKGVVEEIVFTGSSNHPVEVSGTFAGGIVGMVAGGKQEALVASDGEFIYRPRCDSKTGGSKAFFYCGSDVDEDATHDYPAWKTRANTCPSEVRDAFIGSLATKARWTGGHLVMDGADESLSCVRTLEDTRTICGTNAGGIDADGCDWDAAVIAAPGSGGANLLVFARGEGKCAGGERTCAVVLTTFE